jgi:hypothetical protein
LKLATLKAQSKFEEGNLLKATSLPSMINDLMVFGTVVGLVGLGDFPVGNDLRGHNYH